MTLDDLRRAAELLPPGGSLVLPREALLELFAPTGGAPVMPEAGLPGGPPDADEWLTARQVAEWLQTSARWAYDHGRELGARRLSRRCTRFSAVSVARFLARRRG